MTPEPYPTPWRWVDLGLPSRTLWLDRNVGADSPEDAGLYFQWGQKNGHRAGDGFVFSSETYEQQGLNEIQTDLSPENDGAALYYGEHYRMPSASEIRELIQATTILVSERYVELVSIANGNSIKVPICGQAVELSIERPDLVRFDSRTYHSTASRDVFAYNPAGQSAAYIFQLTRYKGIPIRPVYNR